MYGNDKFHGSTSWQVEWSITWKKSSKICYIDTRTLKLNVTFIMPRISPDFSTTDVVIDSFNNYYEALLNHEKGHMDNGIKALKDINLLLENFNSFNDCQVLSKSVESTISKIVEKYKREDIVYDKKTEHGKLQGVSIRKFI